MQSNMGRTFDLPPHESVTERSICWVPNGSNTLQHLSRWNIFSLYIEPFQYCQQTLFSYGPITTASSIPFSAHPMTLFAHPAPESAHFCYYLYRLLAELKQDPIAMRTRIPYRSTPHTTLAAWIKLKELYKPRRMLSSLFFPFINTDSVYQQFYIYSWCDNAKFSISLQFQTILTPWSLYNIVATSVITNCVRLMSFDNTVWV